MKFFFFIFFPFFSFIANAQKSDTTIRYFNEWFVVVPKSSAIYSGISYPENNKWTGIAANDSGKILMTGSYKDKSLKIRDGWFTYFYPNGNPQMRGIFINNSQNGVWMSWYPGGEKKDSIIFRNDSKFGGTAGWFENGNPKYHGKYLFGYADSSWTWYYENGKPSTKEKYEAGKLKSLECFDSSGNYTGVGCALEKAPTIKGYYGGINKYIIDSLYYPEEALKKNIEGVVNLTFNITKEGKLGEIKVIKTPDSLLSNEVIRVLKSVPVWYPAIEHNRPVNQTQSLLIPFYKSGNVPIQEELWF
jgi:TonB family protein